MEGESTSRGSVTGLLEKRRAAGQQTDDGIFSWDPCGIWTDRPRVGADTTKIPAGHALVAPWRAGSLSPALRLPWPSCRSFFQSGGRISVRRSAVIPTAWWSPYPLSLLLSFNVYRFIYSRDSLLTLFPTPGPGATHSRTKAIGRMADQATTARPQLQVCGSLA